MMTSSLQDHGILKVGFTVQQVCVHHIWTPEFVRDSNRAQTVLKDSDDVITLNAKIAII